MKDIIRLPGIIIALLLVGLAYFFMAPLLKLVIEEAGSRTLSTKVTLDSLEIEWAEQSLTLYGLEVADKDFPMNNKVEVDRIALQINALDALTGHLLSDQAHILGVEFNTPRSESGALIESNLANESSGSEDDDSALPGFDLTSLGLPDIDKLVSKENSLTYKRYQSLERYLDEAKKDYKVRIKALKDKEKIEDYKARYEDIKKAKGFVEILSATKKAKSLKDDIDKDISEAKQLNRDFKVTKKEVARRIAQLKDSPQEEADALLKSVGLENGTQKISQYLFGPEMKAHINTLKSWVGTLGNDESNQKIKDAPIERGKGVFVQFRQANPLPLVWFKNTKLSGDLNGLNIPFSFEGDALNLTDQQTLTKQATTLDLNMKNDLVKHANATLIADVRTDKKININFEIQQYHVEKQSLSGSFKLETALLDAKGNINALNDQLGGVIDVELNSVALKTQGDSFSKYPAIETALAAEDQITAKIALKGSIESPQFDINSNLDAIVNSVLKGVVDEQLIKYKSQVTEKIQTMLKEELNGSEASQSDLLAMGGDINGTEDMLTDLLKKL